MGCSLTDPGACLSDLAGSAASSIASSAFNEIAKDFGTAAGDAVNWLWRQISEATAISLSGSAFSHDLAIVATLAVVVATGLFLIQIIASVLRRDGGGLARGVRGLLVAFLGSVAAIAITTLLLAAVDSLSAGFVQVATGGSIQQMGSAILTATSIAAVTNPAAMLLLALIVLGAVVVVWGAMMIRKLLIVVAAVFAPLAFAGATADISTSWVRKWIEMMVALIVSKLILVIIFVIGLGVMIDGLGETAGGSATETVTQTIIGALILLMGGFAPWLAIKLVHFGGDQFQQIHGHAQAATAGAQTVAAAPQKVQSFSSRFGGGSAGGAPTPTGSNGRGLSGSSGPANGQTTSAPQSRPPSDGPSSARGTAGASAASTGAASTSGAAAAAGPAGAAVAVGAAAKGAVDRQIRHVSEVSSSASSTATPAPGSPGGSTSAPGPARPAATPPAPPPSGPGASRPTSSPPPPVPPPKSA